MLYTAKCFWPGVTEHELRIAAMRAEAEVGARPQTMFRGVLYLPGDELALCLFEGPSRASVKHASENARMPCERVIESVWLAPGSKRGEATCGIWLIPSIRTIDRGGMR